MSSSPIQRLAVPELDPVERLRILAAGLPHVALRERVYPVAFDHLWGFIGDLEASAPIMELGIRRTEVLRRDGERLELAAFGALGIRSQFDVVLRPGWCLMQNRLGDIGMAAAPEGSGTRFAHFEGSRWLGRLARPLFARKIAGDLERIRVALSG